MFKSRWFRILAISAVGMITPVLFAAQSVVSKKASVPAKLAIAKPVTAVKTTAKPAVTAKHVATKAVHQTAKTTSSAHHVIAHGSTSKTKLTAKTSVHHKTLVKTPAKATALHAANKH